MQVRHLQGFTFVELLFTVAILAILLTTGVPGLRTFLLDNRLTAMNNRLVLSVNLARSEAGKRGIPVTIAALDPSDSGNEWGKGWQVFTDPNENGVLDAGEELLRVIDDLDDEMVLDSVDDASLLRYRPIGMLDVSPQSRSFLVCDQRSGETGYLVAIGPTGRPSSSHSGCS